MTVAELIARLQTFDQSLPVVVGGFDESGYDVLDTVKPVKLVPIEQTSHGAAFEVPEDVNPRWKTVIG